MLSWAVTFFIIAIISAVFAFSGVAGSAASIAWVITMLGVMFGIIFTLASRNECDYTRRPGDDY